MDLFAQSDLLWSLMSKSKSLGSATGTLGCQSLVFVALGIDQGAWDCCGVDRCRGLLKISDKGYQ